MTLSSDLDKSSNSNRSQFLKFLQAFERIIDILEDFEDNYGKKLNFSKLASLLNIPHAYTDELASLLVKTHDIFVNVFKNHNLKRRRENNFVYLITEKLITEKQIPSEIIFTSAQIKLFNDIIYTFRRVKRGRGFDVSKNGTELLSNLNSLKFEHPYLFERKDNGLIYPSPFGLKLGDLIISYNNGNKEIKNLTIDGYSILVRDNK